MTTDERKRTALRSALAALAPALKLRQSHIHQLAEDLHNGVQPDSFGVFWVTGSGRDLADHVRTVIHPARPELFEAAPRRSTAAPATRERAGRLTTTERRAAASAALAKANGDLGPKL